MRHRVAGRHFNRDTNQRKALLKGLLCALIEHGEMVTTLPKAKEMKRLADKLIYRAQDDTVASRRLLHRFFGRRDVVNTLVERVAPAMKDRSSGFTTSSSVANRRGDNVSMVRISLVTKPERLGTFKSDKAIEVKPKAKAKKVTVKVETASKAKGESKVSAPSQKSPTKVTRKAAPKKKAVRKAAH
jgi:large subunit ribosomal protein L17